MGILKDELIKHMENSHKETDLDEMFSDAIKSISEDEETDEIIELTDEVDESVSDDVINIESDLIQAVSEGFTGLMDINLPSELESHRKAIEQALEQYKNGIGKMKLVLMVAGKQVNVVQDKVTKDFNLF